MYVPWRCLGLATCLLVACTDRGVPGDPTRNLGDGGAACLPGKVWKASSRQIELSLTGSWRGSTGYAATAEQLSAAQLQALDGFCMIDPSAGPRRTDTEHVVLTVTDADGSSARYHAIHLNVAGPELAVPAQAIDWFAVQAFLATFQCLRAGDSRDKPSPLDGGGGLASTAALSADPRCVNGFFAGCKESWARFDVDAGGTYSLSAGRWFWADTCVEGLQMDLYDQTGTQKLASSASSDAGTPSTCTSLATTLDAGTYVIGLGQPQHRSCSDPNMRRGDYTLRVSSP